jgi:hypothetical protein
MRVQQLDCGNQSHQWAAVAAAIDLNREFGASVAKDMLVDDGPGWYWRSAEGKRLMEAHAGSANLDDPEIGCQREED